MPFPPTGRPVLDYASAEVDHGIPFIRPMKRWRATCGLCFYVAVAGLIFWRPVGVGAAAAAVACGAVTLAYMGRAARAEVDAGYAARQLVLAALLSAAFLLGVWVVPILVESDLEKWRLVEARQRERV